MIEVKNAKKALPRSITIAIYLVLILLLIGVYIFIVHIPVKTGIETAQSEIDTYNTENMILQAKLAKMEDMQSELDYLRETDSLVNIPGYDNLSMEMAFLNTIFGPTNNFQLSVNASQDAQDQSIVRRTAQISFETYSYEAAKSVIKRLENWDNLCKIDTVTISPVNKNRENKSITEGTVSVSLFVTFYERIGN